MAKEVFGEYAAFPTRGGVRFMKNGKMTSEDSIPPEVVAFLRDKVGKQDVEAEHAKLMEESLQVPEELKLTPEEEAQRAITGVPDNSEPLVAEDFDEEIVGEDPVVTPSESLESLEPQKFPDPRLITTDEPVRREPTKAASMAQSEFMESVSIHTASLEDISRALYDRFGIYSVYLGTLPIADEVNPLTGEPFTKYHQGIAYQAAISAQAKGLRSPDSYRQSIDQGRAASENFQAQFVPVPTTMGEARVANSFDYRTSTRGTQTIPTTEIVHIKDEITGEITAVQREIPVTERGGVAQSRFDSDEDELIVQPPIFGGKPIVRPNW